MIKGITRASVNMVERYLPNAFVLVLVLTLVVFGAGMLVEGHGPVAMAEFWGDGFWNLLSFSMQMVLILVSGFVVASTPVFKRLLQALAKLARSPGQGIVLVTVVSLIAAWVNWGFGLVIGALFARELARCLPNLDYRLAIASAYSGFMVWHGGLSGSIPLVIATEGHFTAEMIGIIPTSETIFSVMNLGILLALLIVIPLVNWLITPAAGDAVTVDPAKLIDEEPNSEEVADTPSTRLENSMILSLISGLLGILYIGYYIFGTDGGLNLNIVNFTLIFAGILLHGRPSQFLTSVKKAVNGASGIIVQFPFYAGIMGMMVGSGLAVTLSEAFVSISSAKTLPFFTFLSWHRQHVRALGRGPMGGTGPDHAGGKRGAWGLAGPHGNGRGLARYLDQPDPAVLGAAGAGNRGPLRQGHHGILPDRPRGHRRGAWPGTDVPALIPATAQRRAVLCAARFSLRPERPVGSWRPTRPSP
ncbi:short-chain fatty acid transporter [Mameliella alba]|uniref:short-chain fatty acid transporter n=1 Tax=Mameliella alba TaxID=561184 RepID=UPI001802370B